MAAPPMACGSKWKSTRAIWEALGTVSRSSSSRFAVNSVFRRLMPVRLPPGRARLATRPSLTGSSLTVKTMGDRRGCGLGRERRRRAMNRGDHGDLPANQFSRQLRSRSS
jgi:hypothetical protein